MICLQLVNILEVVEEDIILPHVKTMMENGMIIMILHVLALPQIVLFHQVLMYYFIEEEIGKEICRNIKIKIKNIKC